MSAIKLESKYSGSCRACGGVVKVGDPVFWTPGVKGVVHESCPDLSKDTQKIAVEPLYKLGGSEPHPDFPGLFEHQREVVNGMSENPAARLFLAWSPGLGKAQPLDAGVLTPNGFVRMGDISVGDEVLTPQGLRSKVIGVYPQGEEPVFRITLTDGSSTLASGNHLWTLIKTSRGRGGTRHTEVTMTTNELMSSSLQESDGRRRYRLPDVKIAERKSEVRIDPYILGVLIGDGSMSQDSICLTSTDPEIFESVERLLPYGVSMKSTSDPATKRLSLDTVGGRNPLITELRALGLMGKTSHDKFIPDSYKYASRQLKIELIRGLMDTDGYVSADNALEFCSVSSRLAHDFANVIRSLGGYARVAEKKTSWTYKGIYKTGIAYRVTFNCDLNPFRLERKASVWRPVSQRQRRIKSIEPAGVAETQCILIDHPDHLYVTDDYIPTHNTLGALASAKESNSFPLIIVCPSVVKINWQREAKRWINKDAQVLSSRKPYPIESDVVIVNYDILDAWTDALIDMNAKGIIFDEAHYVKNAGSKRTQAAREVAKSVKGMRFALSGTPTPNSVHDLVMPLEILDVLKHFGGRNRYIKRYCPPVQTRYGVSYKKARNVEELHKNLTNACFVRRRREDCLDLPEKIRVDIPVSVSVKDDMEFYGPLVKLMKKGTLAEATRVVKQNVDKAKIKGQIATERAQAGEAKISSIVEIANDIDEPLVIMVHHKSVVAELMKKLKKRNPVKLVGGMTPAARQQSIDDFQNGKSDLMIASITAAGVGINLQRGTAMIIGELPLTYAELEQAESRCHRSGAKNDLTVYRVVALGTFDEPLTGIIARKEATSAAVEDGLEVESVTSQDLLAKKLLDIYKKTKLDS